MKSAGQKGILRFGAAAIGILFAVLIPSAVSGQMVVLLSVEDALKVRSVAGLAPWQFSPEGKKFAYTVQDNQRKRLVSTKLWRETGVPSWALGCDIVVFDITSRESRNITNSAGNSWLPTWSPDGRYLSFLSDRGQEGYARLWVWDAIR